MTATSTTTESMLIDLVKNHANMTRKPRNLKVFYTFLYTWRIHNNKKSKCMYKDRMSKDIFISTTTLQKKLSVNKETYEKYFDAWINEWDNEEYSFLNGKCKTIKSFTSQFIDLMNNPIVEKCVIPHDIKKSIAASTSHVDSLELKSLQSIINKSNLTNEEKMELLQDYETSSFDSPFRGYRPIKNIERKLRAELFKGCYDIDLEQAFASIAWFQLGMNESNVAYASFLMPENKKDFRNKVMEDFKIEDEKKAKTLINCLFSKHYTHSWGVQWFDNLHKEITRLFKKNTKTKVIWNGKSYKLDTMHKYFTYHEQLIIKNLEVMTNSVLNMHDGIISLTKPKTNYVEYNGNQYKLSIDKF